jgi:predicted GIY-YIG superfamily endonuclease
MGQLYVLKLRGGKWYVGYTDRSSMDRILEHIEKKGAKWTKAHPPLKKGYLHNFTTPGKTREDEDKRTLYLMKQHGIENVRGGSWCMVKMRKKTIRELEGLIAKTKPKASAKKKAKKKATQGYCIRCGDRKKFEVGRPMCIDCYDIWVQYSNPDYIEKHCHKCGRRRGTSIDRPLCTSCWRKSR